MDNYKRYDLLKESRYNKRGLSYLLMRKKLDRTIIPYIKQINSKSVLEVGIGYGYYLNVYSHDNHIVGFDVNPEMGSNLGIEIIAGKADEIGSVNRKFDRILSFFMTEYLNKDELQNFINDSIDLILNDEGIFTTTIIVKKGLGRIYTKLATIKGINKYSYKYSEIEAMVRGRDYRLIPLNTYCRIPMAVMLEVKK